MTPNDSADTIVVGGDEYEDDSQGGDDSVDSLDIYSDQDEKDAGTTSAEPVEPAVATEASQAAPEPATQTQSPDHHSSLSSLSSSEAGAEQPSATSPPADELVSNSLSDVPTADEAASPGDGQTADESQPPTEIVKPANDLANPPNPPDQSALPQIQSMEVDADAPDETNATVAPIHNQSTEQLTHPLPAHPPAAAAASVSDAIPASLPPKPSPPLKVAQPQPRAGSAQQPLLGGASINASPVSSIPFPTPSSMGNTGQASTFVAAGAPGTSSDHMQNLPPPPGSTFSPTQTAPQFTGAQGLLNSSPAAQDAQVLGGDEGYERFLADERRYMTEAKWEKFPDGSRIFIGKPLRPVCKLGPTQLTNAGNLSQERVSKRDVFDLFHKYGRLAQISLKSAYGFVQYHNTQDAQGAMQNLQGAEVKGRRIRESSFQTKLFRQLTPLKDLEYSRPQKDKGRDRSPDRNKNRGGRGADRYDGREGRRSRDDYRREASPRRDDRRARENDHYSGRDRQADSYRSRGRSRSPNRFTDSYRSRRSPSPQYGHRSTDGASNFDMPRRYGSDIPDVQFLLTQQLDPAFIQWVQKAFSDVGLRTDVMFLNLRNFSRDTVIQRQVLEGVHAVCDLDFQAQGTGKIRLQVFDRSAGTNNVRFDVYQDILPNIAAQIVLRAKGTAQQQPSYAPPVNYGQQYPPSTYAPQAYPTPQAYAPATGPQQAAATPDLSRLLGQADNATLQQLIASLQGGQPAAAAPPPTTASPAQPTYPQGPPSAGAAPSNVDINALLGSIRNNATPQSSSPTTASYPGYPAAPGGASQPAAAGNVDSQAAVQSIMAQLARYRQ